MMSRPWSICLVSLGLTGFASPASAQQALHESWSAVTCKQGRVEVIVGGSNAPPSGDSCRRTNLTNSGRSSPTTGAAHIGTQVDSQTQQQRDSDSKRILLSELLKEEIEVEKLSKSAQADPAALSRAKLNVEALRRELRRATTPSL